MTMITIETRVPLDGVTGAEITAFMLDPTDERYQAWWPGIHLAFHVVSEGRVDHIGDVVWMDEYVGRRRLRMRAVVVDVVPGRRITWQFKFGIRLPARLQLELADRDGGCALRHVLTAGFSGAGRILDPLLRLYLSPRFAMAMDAHARTEFPRLRDHLASRRQAA